MKRCSKCRRDYFDDELNFCLDDGTRLLDGPAIQSEAATELLHSVSIGGVPVGAHDRQTKNAASNQPESVAILPFRNLTRDESVSFYEFSLADAVITELARLRSLAVCPSSIVAKYLGQSNDPRETGRELAVNAVLSASFLHTKNRIRVNTQLINVGTGTIMWGDRIDVNADDIITVQDTIARSIVDGLQVKLTASRETDLPQKATDNPAAYEHYLRGRDRMRRYIYQSVANEDVVRAIEHFRQAVSLDPKFAQALSALGSSYLQRVFKGLGSPEDIANAREALDAALVIDPQMIDANAYRSYIYLVQNEKVKAHRQLANLRREAPHNSLVHFLSGVFYRQAGDYENSLHSWKEMLRVDPTARVIADYNRARIYMYQQRLDEALAILHQAATVDPNHPILKFFHAVAIFRSGETARAADMLRSLLHSHPRDVFRPNLAMCLSVLGHHQEARAELTEDVKTVATTDPDIAYWLASAYLLEGEKDEALEWLGRSIELGNDNRPWLERNPIWEPLKGDPQFQQLMSQTIKH